MLLERDHFTRLPGARYFSVKSRSQQETGCNSDVSKEDTLIKGLSEAWTELRESAGLLQPRMLTAEPGNTLN